MGRVATGRSARWWPWCARGARGGVWELWLLGVVLGWVGRKRSWYNYAMVVCRGALAVFLEVFLDQWRNRWLGQGDYVSLWSIQNHEIITYRIQ
jgi:hypothetical protein